MNLELVWDYLYYKNDVCPCCRSSMKVCHDHTVKNGGAIAAGIYPNPINRLIPYALCKSCTKAAGTLISKGNAIEQYMLEVLEIG